MSDICETCGYDWVDRDSWERGAVLNPWQFFDEDDLREMHNCLPHLEDPENQDCDPLCKPCRISRELDRRLAKQSEDYKYK